MIQHVGLSLGYEVMFWDKFWLRHNMLGYVLERALVIMQHTGFSFSYVRGVLIMTYCIGMSLVMM